MEEMAHFNPERVPGRLVNAKGARAHGTLTIIHQLSKCARAKLF
jgi:catalase